LTDRELDVLRLLGQGKTNPGDRRRVVHQPTHHRRAPQPTSCASSPPTTGVRATIADRAGLLDSVQANTPLAHT
jgi:hypothetical protein